MQCAVWWSSRAGSHAQLLPVTQQAGGPRRRKLPGCTVALKAPPLTTSAAYFCDSLKTPKLHHGGFKPEAAGFGVFLCFLLASPVVFRGWGGVHHVSVRVNSAAAGYSLQLSCGAPAGVTRTKSTV